MKNALINYMKNDINDELYTPLYAVLPLIKFLPNNKTLTIWECTDFGDSNITKCLKLFGFSVISTHISNFDFLNDVPNFDFDIIITNPPYSIKDKFIEKCYSYGKPFALLLPLTTLEGIYRGRLFSKYGVEVLVFDRRINYMFEKKSNWFNTSWFCWNLLPDKLIFESLDSNININQLTIYDFIKEDK